MLGNHILFDQGVVDAYGHLSARHPDRPDRFLLAWAVAPGIVARGDILTFDLEGNVLDGKGQELYSERFIHAAIFAARPDVGAIVHSHSPAIIPFGVTEDPLRPIWHISSFLDGGIPVFDTQDVAGDTDLLIKNMALGRALAASLGDKPVVLMRGHGSVAVGSTIHQAVYRGVYTEVNAQIQAEAMRRGKVKYLTAGEAALMNATNDPNARRPWDLWRRAAQANRR